MFGLPSVIPNSTADNPALTVKTHLAPRLEKNFTSANFQGE